MTLDKQLNTSFQIVLRDLARKPDASPHVEGRISRNDFFEREKTTLRNTGEQAKGLNLVYLLCISDCGPLKHRPLP